MRKTSSNSSKTWTPERHAKYRETMRRKREDREGNHKKPSHSLTAVPQVATLRDVIDALDSDLRTLRDILGM